MTLMNTVCESGALGVRRRFHTKLLAWMCCACMPPGSSKLTNISSMAHSSLWPNMSAPISTILGVIAIAASTSSGLSFWVEHRGVRQLVRLLVVCTARRAEMLHQTFHQAHALSALGARRTAGKQAKHFVFHDISLHTIHSIKKRARSRRARSLHWSVHQKQAHPVRKLRVSGSESNRRPPPAP